MNEALASASNATLASACDEDEIDSWNIMRSMVLHYAEEHGSFDDLLLH